MMKRESRFFHGNDMKMFILMYLELMGPLVSTSKENIEDVVTFSLFVETCLTDSKNRAHNRDLLKLLADKRIGMEKLWKIQ